MQNQQQNDGPGDQFDTRNAFNGLALLVYCHSSCVTVFFRRYFGREGLGLNGVGAFLMMVLTLGISGEIGMLWFLSVWMLLVIFHRVNRLREWLLGIVRHSHFAGEPWLGQFFTKRDGVIRMLIEPLVCVLAGGVILWLGSPVLGMFVMSGALSLIAVYCVQREVIQARAQHMLDAEIEMRLANARYKEPWRWN
jgi:hypothetical protein